MTQIFLLEFGKATATALFTETVEEIVVHLFQVEILMQRQGSGGRLLNTIEKMALEKRIIVEIVPGSHAVAFWDACGFQCALQPSSCRRKWYMDTTLYTKVATAGAAAMKAATAMVTVLAPPSTSETQDEQQQQSSNSDSDSDAAAKTRDAREMRVAAETDMSAAAKKKKSPKKSARKKKKSPAAAKTTATKASDQVPSSIVGRRVDVVLDDGVYSGEVPIRPTCPPLFASSSARALA